MKLTQEELVLVGLLIVYIAFFTHPVPKFLAEVFRSPVGHAVALGGILYVTVYQSLIVGVFMAIAYVMSNSQVTEYMENPKQVEPPQPKSEGVHPPAVTGAIASLLKKGDTRPPSHSSKKGVNVPKPPETKEVKPKAPSSHENFSNF
jgi:hypothetical protein